MEKQITNKSADNIRILSAAMVEKAKSGHPGGAMGGADFVNILYSEFLNFNPNDGEWFIRDRFFLDPGHMSPMLYAVLSMAGYFSVDELKDFRQWGSAVPGHPEKEFTRGIENTSGPLGMGHTIAVGAAIAERFLCDKFGEWMAHKTYTFISDGGIQEEISQGAGRIAGHLGLSNLIMYYDSNDIQLSTEVSEVTSEDTAKKYESWGWKVFNIDGNDAKEIRWALSKANEEKDKPSLIIGKTIMGKGAVDDQNRNFEGQCSTHGMPLSNAGASFSGTIKNLGGDPQNPFLIFEEVKDYWKNALARKKDHYEEKHQQQLAWQAKHPDLWDKLQSFLDSSKELVDFTQIDQKVDNSSRGASGIVLGHFAKHIENMIVASADLSNSDKTDSFLKETSVIKKEDFSGKFLQVGVSELTMGAIANGIALHGGIITACATFFVFSDYMKPAVRMAALMELPVKYVWTHDSFRVGEDGPTHQPIEHEAQIRLMEHLKNHSGSRSMLVLRPADADETTVAWQLALKNVNTPTALLLSRQNIKSIDYKGHVDRYQMAFNAKFGAYIVYATNSKPDMILVASGSEVSTLCGAAKIIEEKLKLSVQIVSVISEGLFKDQTDEYREKIIPKNVKKIGLTAGLSICLQGIVGDDGHIIGCDTFGHSAPAGVLDDKLGYTAEKVFEAVAGFFV